MVFSKKSKVAIDQSSVIKVYKMQDICRPDERKRRITALDSQFARQLLHLNQVAFHGKTVIEFITRFGAPAA